MKKILVFGFVCLFAILFSSCAMTITSKNSNTEDCLINPFASVFWVDAGNDPLGMEDLVIDEMREYHLIAFSIDERNTHNKSSSSGTCFAIADDTLLTNQHVVGKGNQVFVLINGEYVSASVVYQDERNDIAIIKLERVLPYFFRICPSDEVKKGDLVRVIGYPLSSILRTDESTVTEGIVNSLSGIEDNPLEIQLSAEIQSGNSGSPVLNDKYQVIGMASSSLSDLFMLKLAGQTAQNANFAIKSDLIKLVTSSFLKTAGSSSKAVSSLNEAEQAVFPVFAYNPTTSNVIDYGYSEFFVRIGYLSSWYSGRNSIDKIVFSVSSSEGNTVFSEMYRNWRFNSDIYNDFITDLGRLIDQSEYAFGYIEE